MKEKYFKVTESMAKATESLGDFRRGKLMRVVSDYVFKGKVYEGKDVTIKSNFILIKKELDAQEQDKMYGKLGGQKSAESGKGKDKPCFTRMVVGGETVNELVKDLFSAFREKTEQDEKNPNHSEEKTGEENDGENGAKS